MLHPSCHWGQQWQQQEQQQQRLHHQHGLSQEE
jgi:hypothetical protein